MKATAIAVAAGLASASAFLAPPLAQRAPAGSASAVRMVADQKLQEWGTGVSAPFEEGFDPASISKNPSIDNKQLKRYREAELKHCRVAMLAFVGLLVQERFHPLLSIDDAQLGPASFHLQTVDAFAPWLSLVLLAGIGLTEVYTIGKGWSKEDYQPSGVANLKEGYRPGDLGFDPLGLAPKDEAGFKNMQTKELNNGRLAMFATLGIWAQELVDHQSIWQHWNLV